MIAKHKTVSVNTKERIELIDITKQVEDFVNRRGIKEGLCVVYAPHATTAIIANENEPGLIQDTIKKIEEEFPKDADWKHNRIDSNAHAHLASSFIGTSKVFPIVDGRLIRGEWQNVFLVELDGPRSKRNVVIQVIGE